MLKWGAMDIYEFTQVLWRRRGWLFGGFVLLLVVVVALAVDFSDGIKLRVNPKYQATVQMAVVPDSFDSLAQDLGSQSLASPATIFSSVLSSPQAALEIEKLTGVTVLALTVSTSGRDRFFSVTALSDSPEGAVVAALGAFDWLERRLSEPLLTASLPTEVSRIQLDAEGRLLGTVRLQFDHTLASDSEGLWLVTSVESGEGYAYRLAAAADEPAAEYTSLLTPGGVMSLVLEDAAGTALDSLTVELPTLPSTEAAGYRLIVALDRGLIRGTTESPRFDAERVGVNWEPLSAASGTTVAQTADVSVLLLTDAPVPESIGGRRLPLLVIAFSTAFIIAFLVFVVAVDSWILERKLRADSGSRGAADLPGPIALSGEQLPDERQEAAQDPSPWQWAEHKRGGS
jgi:hypothetical protein